MNIKKFCLIILYILLGTICLCGCSQNQEDSKLEEKMNSEIKYLDKRIVGIMNKLNNITLENFEVKSKEIASQKEDKSKEGGQASDGGQSSEQSNAGSESEGESSSEGKSENDSTNQKLETSQGSENIKVLQMQPSNILVVDKNDIDWVTIKSEIEMIYSIWNSMLLDLYKLNIQNEDILNFSKALDNAIMVAKEEDKSGTLEALANLYSFLPKYAQKLPLGESEKNIIQAKSNIVNAYALVEQDNWQEVQNQINKADESYTKVTSDIKYIEDKQEQVSRVYILIKELKNSINTQDKDIFYIKYKSLMNAIM